MLEKSNRLTSYTSDNSAYIYRLSRYFLPAHTIAKVIIESHFRVEAFPISVTITTNKENLNTKTPSQVALNWIRQQLKDKAVIIPIIGARTEVQVKDNMGCLDFELTSDQEWSIGCYQLWMIKG